MVSFDLLVCVVLCVFSICFLFLILLYAGSYFSLFFVFGGFVSVRRPTEHVYSHIHAVTMWT